MSSSYHSLDPGTLQLLHEEWERMPGSTSTEQDGASRERKTKPKQDPYHAHELSPVIAVLPGLIRLVHECTDRPVNKFRPVIKRLILEQVFMEVGGDSIVDAQHMMQVREHVELTVRVLVKVRHHGLGKDEWSDAPVTPMMFG